MGTRPEDGSGLDRARRDRDLLHDHSGFLVRGGRRPRNLAGVVRPRAESEQHGEGNRQHPVGQARDEDPDAEDPCRGRDEVGEDEEPDGEGAEPMEPLRLVDGETVRGGVGLAVPAVCIVLLP